MELVRWNPHRRLTNFNDRFGSLFDNFSYPTLRHDDTVTHGDWHPVVDIYEDEGAFVVTAEIPGVDKKDIEIDVKDRVLTLRGERLSDRASKEDTYYRRERSYGKFERTFSLPENVNADTIEASFKDGVLKLEIPKPEEIKPKSITVH
ncbi:MAG: Hsp20/alpha crystallin family protein [Desulfobacterales bacterium]